MKQQSAATVFRTFLGLCGHLQVWFPLSYRQGNWLGDGRWGAGECRKKLNQRHRVQGWVRIERKTHLIVSQGPDDVSTLRSLILQPREWRLRVQTYRWSCPALKSSLLFAEPAMEPLCCHVAIAQVLSFSQPIYLSVHPSHSS